MSKRKKRGLIKEWRKRTAALKHNQQELNKVKAKQRAVAKMIVEQEKDAIQVTLQMELLYLQAIITMHQMVKDGIKASWLCTVHEKYGNIKVAWENWHPITEDYDCILENGEVYKANEK